MSKLNRREFKELLSEWRNNFVNERVTPDLSKHISAPKQNFTIINVEEANPEFKKKLSERNISFNLVGVTGLILKCSKRGNTIKDFIVNNFTLNENNKNLLNRAYDEEAPILVSSLNYSGDYDDVGQSHSKEECLNWLIHDLFHANFDGMRVGQYFLNFPDIATRNEYIEKYKTLLPNSEFNNIDLDNLMDGDEEFTKYAYDYEKKKHDHIIPELVSYFDSINFTVGIESFDLIPSIFSYCMIKMPDPDDIESLKFLLDTTRLSDEAKKYLLIFNIEAKKKFKEEVIPMFAGTVSFLDLNR